MNVLLPHSCQCVFEHKNVTLNHIHAAQRFFSGRPSPAGHTRHTPTHSALHPPAASGPRRLFHPSTLRMSDPILAYSAESEVNQLQWSKTQPDWVAIAFDKKLQILRV